MVCKEKPNKMQQCIKIFIIPHLYEAQDVSGDIANHQEPKTALAASGFFMWKVVGRVGTLCLTTSTNYTSNNLPRMKNQRLPVQF